MDLVSDIENYLKHLSSIKLFFAVTYDEAISVKVCFHLSKLKESLMFLGIVWSLP